MGLLEYICDNWYHVTVTCYGYCESFKARSPLSTSTASANAHHLIIIDSKTYSIDACGPRWSVTVAKYNDNNNNNTNKS